MGSGWLALRSRSQRSDSFGTCHSRVQSEGLWWKGQGGKEGGGTDLGSPDSSNFLN